jgi:hypothetical protein
VLCVFLLWLVAILYKCYHTILINFNLHTHDLSQAVFLSTLSGVHFKLLSFDFIIQAYLGIFMPESKSEIQVLV